MKAAMGEGRRGRRTETLLDVRPYFCIAALRPPLFSAAAFLVDFIINYLNAFDSRIMPPVPFLPPFRRFPSVNLAERDRMFSRFFSVGKSNITLMIIFISPRHTINYTKSEYVM